MKKPQIIAALLALIILGLVAFLWFGRTAKENTNITEESTATNEDGAGNNENVNLDEEHGATNTTTNTTPSSITFSTPKKSAHYETNTPAHGDTLPASPINVVIDFNFDLAPPSSLSITKDGVEYGTGTTIIDDGKLGLRRALPPSMPDGLYVVTYDACWPDGSCHDGMFQFAIDRSVAATYRDERGKTAVSVELANISINPARIRISRNTTVTWVNNDEFGHYVNTDAHPAHTYFPEQNSRELLTGDTFSVTFTEPGFYPYHCSAHPEEMMGGIIVE